MIKKLILILYLLTASHFLNAQYSSIRLEALCKQLEIHPKMNDTLPFQVIEKVKGCPNFKVRAEYNETNDISHVGLFLFEQLDSIDFSRELLLFLERELLELYISKQHKNVVQIIEKDKLSLSFNGNDFIHGPFWDVKTGIEAILNFSELRFMRDSLVYTAILKDSKNELIIRFPANIQVITGMDKRELDEAFISDLLSADTTFLEKELYPLKQGEPITHCGGGIFLKKGDCYIIEQVNSDKFYALKDNYLSLVYNEKYSVESFRNLFYQDNKDTRNLSITIGQRLYNKEYKYVTMSVGAFARAINSRYQVFTGVEKADKDDMVITLLLYGKDNNIVHIFEVHANENSLFSENNRNPIMAKARANIPTDNIETLYGEYDMSENKSLPKYEVIIKR